MIAELETTAAPATGAQIQRINLSELHPSPTNPRKHFDEKGLRELAASIEEHRVKMPLLVRPSKTLTGKFEIVAGERRYRASVKLLEALADRGQTATEEEAERLNALYADRSEVRVIVEDLDDATVLELQLIENLQRKDLTALEEAQGYQSLLDLKEKNYTPLLIAQKIGKSIDTVLNKLKMLQAPKELRKALEEGIVTERHLVLVAGIPGEKARKECTLLVLEGEYDWQINGRRPKSVRETNQLITARYRQTLKGAPWDLDDAELLPSAGPCATCPNFARHAATQDAELAAELGNGRGQMEPLTCMNPGCFKQKQEVIWKRKQAAAKKGEVTVLSAKEAEEIVTDQGQLRSSSTWVKLESKLDSDIMGHYDESKSPMWRTVVEDRLPPGAIHVVNTERGGIIELVKKKDAIEAGKAHKKHGKLFEKLKAGGKKVLTPAEQKKKDKETFDNKVTLRVKTCALQYLFERALEKGMDASAGIAVLDSHLHEAGMDGNRLICDWLKLEPAPVKKGNSLSQEHYREAILKSLRERDAGKPEIDAMIMIAGIAKWVKTFGLEVSSVTPLMTHFGFDKKTITAIAANEVQAELDAKAAKKKPAKPEKPASKNSTDPSNVSVEKEVSKTKAADARAKTLGVGKLAPEILGKGPAKVAAETKKVLSPDARKEIAAAQQKRWAKQKEVVAKKTGKSKLDAGDAAMLDAQATRIRAGEGYPAVLGPRPADTKKAAEWDKQKTALSEEVKKQEAAMKSRRVKKSLCEPVDASPSADADYNDAE